MLDPHAAAGGVELLPHALATGAVSSAGVTEWAKGTVLRVPLDTRGATAEAVPFLSGLEHPLPVLATHDGALLVGDWGTGTIYRIARG